MSSSAPPALSKAEKSYITDSLSLSPPHRTDGRPLHAYRNVALETGDAPLANGSAHVRIGGTSGIAGGGGTEVRAGVKLEVVNDQEAGSVAVTVTCSPAAYPHLSSSALDHLESDLTHLMDEILSHKKLLPANLTIIPPPNPHPKSWHLGLGLLVLSCEGNVLDALFIAARAALADTKVPRTREIVYRAPGTGTSTDGGKDVAMEGIEGTNIGGGAGLDTRQHLTAGSTNKGKGKAADFELVDHWDEGEPLEGGHRWPVGITMNVVDKSDVYFLDASLEEEAAAPSHLFLAFSFPDPSKSSEPKLCGMRFQGPGELKLDAMGKLMKDGVKHATSLRAALDAKITQEQMRRGAKAKAQFSKRR